MVIRGQNVNASFLFRGQVWACESEIKCNKKHVVFSAGNDSCCLLSNEVSDVGVKDRESQLCRMSR